MLNLSTDSGQITPEIFEPSPRQQAFIDAVFSGEYRHLLYGGAVGGGKTVVLIFILTLLCRAYPGSRWAVIRKDLPRLKRNFLPSWERFAPSSFFGKINRSTWDVKATNGSEVIFVPASEDTDREHNRLRGLEISGAVVEECNEISEEFLNILVTRCGRWPSAPTPLPLILLSCNPTQAWPKRRFYDPFAAGRLEKPLFYLPAKVTDNPFLTDEYRAALKMLPPHQYQVLVEGDWSLADDPDALIEAAWVDSAINRDVGDQVLASRLGVDVARYGDDQTVLALITNYQLTDLWAYSKIDTARTANITRGLIDTHNLTPENVRVDTVGVGGGVADVLAQGGFKPTEFIAGAKPTSRDFPPEKRGYLSFRNLRSEAWWNVRELLKHKVLCFSQDLSDVDRIRLMADLLAPRYSVDSDKQITVESKDQIKKRLGRSPDYGDAVIMALADMPKPSKFIFVSV